jgi:NAD(P)-dependent dehydrogenase (short-subunit alcohol dehydrogenase family)
MTSHASRRSASAASTYWSTTPATATARPLIAVLAVEPGAFRTSFLRNVAQPPETIGDYAGTVGARREQDTARHGRRPGDPVRAAQAIITAVQSPDPPRLLVLGPDALTQFRDVATELTSDVNAWEQLSLSTSFPERG